MEEGEAPADLRAVFGGLSFANLESDSRKKVQLHIQGTISVLERNAGTIEVSLLVFALAFRGHQKINNFLLLISHELPPTDCGLLGDN
jgi:hypothetical protein